MRKGAGVVGAGEEAVAVAARERETDGPGSVPVDILDPQCRWDPQLEPTIRQSAFTPLGRLRAGYGRDVVVVGTPGGVSLERHRR